MVISTIRTRVRKEKKILGGKSIKNEGLKWGKLTREEKIPETLLYSLQRYCRKAFKRTHKET